MTTKTNITGRDGLIICKALAYAIEAIDRLPPAERAASPNRILDSPNGAEGAA